MLTLMTHKNPPGGRVPPLPEVKKGGARCRGIGLNLSPIRECGLQERVYPAIYR